MKSQKCRAVQESAAKNEAGKIESYGTLAKEEDDAGFEEAVASLQRDSEGGAFQYVVDSLIGELETAFKFEDQQIGCRSFKRDFIALSFDVVENMDDAQLSVIGKMIEERLKSLFLYYENCKQEYPEHVQIETAITAVFLYELLLFRCKLNKSISACRQKVAPLSASQLEMLNLLRKYGMLRYSECLNYLKVGEYWRSSTTYNRELNQLVRMNLVKKNKTEQKAVYILTPGGRAVLDDNLNVRLQERQTPFKLEHLYLNSDFISSKVLAARPQGDRYKTFSSLNWIRLATLHEGWENSLEVWLTDSGLAADFVTDDLQDIFAMFTWAALDEYLQHLKEASKSEDAFTKSIDTIAAVSRPLSGLVERYMHCVAGYHLLVGRDTLCRYDNFILSLFSQCILEDKYESFMVSAQHYGVEELGYFQCIVDYCRSVILSAVYRRLSETVMRLELSKRLNLSPAIANELAQKIARNKKEIMGKIEYVQ